MSSQLSEVVRFAGINEPADLCVVLVNYNTAHLLERCIGNLREASRNLRVRVVLVDNASRDGSPELIRNVFPDCVLIANTANVGFGRANNQALEYCHGLDVLLLNTDAFVFADTLSKSIAHFKANPKCGVLGVRLVDEDDIGSYTGRTFWTPWRGFLEQSGLTRFVGTPLVQTDPSIPLAGAWHCDWVVGCYYLVRREVIEQVGLFDPRYFLYFEEVDHCHAVKRAGWSVECLADARVIHVGGASAETEGELTSAGRQLSTLQIESELLYFRKHSGLVGVLLTISLRVLADMICAVKWSLKLRPSAGVKTFWTDALAVFRSAWQTRLGARGTR